jgi:hypothetical protein
MVWEPSSEGRMDQSCSGRKEHDFYDVEKTSLFSDGANEGF